MTIYLLIHEQDTDAAWGCDVKPFTDKQAAQDAMKEDWEDAARTWEYDAKDHGDEDECECTGMEAVIRDDSDVERWRIEERQLTIPVSVAIEVSGGLVQNVYAKGGDVGADVFDLDVSDFPEEGEREAAKEREKELDELVHSPGWERIW